MPDFKSGVLVLWLLSALVTPALCGNDSLEIAASVQHGKALLKEHLKELNKAYPFTPWTVSLSKASKALEAIRPLALKRPVDRSVASQFHLLDKELDALRSHRPDVQKLINEMYVQVVVFRVQERSSKNGESFSIAAREELIRQLKPFEAGSLQPKTAFLAGLASVEKSFTTLKNDWLIAYAEEFLANRIEGHLKGFDLQKNESLYDGYALQLDYWRGQLSNHPAQSRDELNKIGEKWKVDRLVVQSILGKLTEVLNTDMLYSDLLGAAQEQGVDFPVDVEERLENQLSLRQIDLRMPLEQRKQAWNAFQIDLKALIDQATLLAANQKNQQLVQEEQDQIEKKQLAALKAEQEKQEQEQREKFKETLNALKSFTFKSENSVSLDEDANKALGTRTGFLKSSYVGNGKVKLKVSKEKFNDTLAFVDKFQMAEGKVDLSNMSLDEKTSQSAYVYTSPKGRTSKEDLNQFVNLVALGSFSTGFTFFSYVPSGNWRPNGEVHWKPDKASQQVAQDRNFSYVDLVVDAHRKRSGVLAAGQSNSYVKSVNVPANLIIFFDEGGGIKRFLSFADVSEISVSNGDLSGGKLYYKFLNYSTDRENIYLNGIDPEIKSSRPST